MRLTTSYIGAAMAVLCIGATMDVSEAAQPAVAAIDNMTIYVKEPVRFQVRATDPGVTLAYSVTGLPAGASINTASGRFSWQPAIDDTGMHTATFTVSDGTSHASMDVVMTVVMPTLPTGAAFKVLRPNGGEVYTYGDSVNLVFVSPLCATEAIVWFCWGRPPYTGSPSGRNMMYTNSSSVWLMVGASPVDARGVACRYFYSFPEQGVNVGFYRMALRDTTVGSFKRLNFGGDTVRVDSMLVKILDQYGDTKPCDMLVQQGLLSGDLSDGYFSVRPRSQAGVIRGALHRNLQLYGTPAASAVTVYSLTGRIIRQGGPANTHDAVVPVVVRVGGSRNGAFLYMMPSRGQAQRRP